MSAGEDEDERAGEAEQSTSEGDRRRAERVMVNEEFAAIPVDVGPGSTWVSDLSATGVFVHSSEILPVGSEIELRFSVLLDDPVIVETAGRVARHSQDPLGMGVEFVELSDEAREQIEECLERRRPRDSGAPLGAARFAPPPLPKNKKE